MICNECGKTFSASFNLNRHVKTAHLNEEFACDHCAYRTTRKDNFVRHKRQHVQSAEEAQKPKQRKRFRRGASPVRTLEQFNELERVKREEQEQDRRMSSNVPLTQAQLEAEAELLREYEEVLLLERQREAIEILRHLEEASTDTSDSDEGDYKRQVDADNVANEQDSVVFDIAHLSKLAALKTI